MCSRKELYPPNKHAELDLPAHNRSPARTSHATTYVDKTSYLRLASSLGVTVSRDAVAVHISFLIS